ncbi:MAG: HAD family hydrolase [Planctomycetota bacterium]|jgi:HAD superfamily hydrolase (TIGR01509 family)
MIRAVVFDLDGVLIDSEPIWERVTRELLARHGRTFDRVIADQHMGMRLVDVVAAVLEAHDLGLDPEEFAKDLLDNLLAEFERTLERMPGAEDAMKLAASLGLAVALATGSPRRVADAVIARYGWRFDTICTGDDVERGKPAPEIYQLAAERLGVDPGACVAIEDSRNGVRAAKDAGMVCIAVPEPWEPADFSLPTLEALTPQHLQGRRPEQQPPA